MLLSAATGAAAELHQGHLLLFPNVTSLDSGTIVLLICERAPNFEVSTSSFNYNLYPTIENELNDFLLKKCFKVGIIL